MSLINCPECHKQISDKAQKCPDCGFPMNTPNIPINNDQTYNVILKNTGIYGNKIRVINCIKNVLGLENRQASELAINVPSLLKKNISFDKANQIQKEIELSGAEVVLEPYNENQNDKILLEKYKTNILICPRCNSSAVITGQRGYSLLTGFFGSNKTVNRCGKCGYYWQP